MLSRVQLFAAPWTIAHQAPLSMAFSWHWYWRGLPFPTPGHLPDPEIKPASLVSPALAGRFFTTEPPGKASLSVLYVDIVGLPRWHNGKEFTCQCRRHKRCRFDPRVGKIPWSRKWQPDPVFVSGKFHGQRFLGDYCPWGHEESDTIEHTHISTPTPVAISSGSAQRGWAKMPISHFP